MEGLSENENQGMQNEKKKLFISEIKIEEKVQGIEQNPSSQIESNIILRVNEKKLQTKDKKLIKFWNNCIFKEENGNHIIGMFYIGFFIVLMAMQKSHLKPFISCVVCCVIPNVIFF